MGSTPSPSASGRPTRRRRSRWSGPARGSTRRRSARRPALLSGGVDVIAQHQDTAGPAQAAEAEGKYAVGYDSDQASAAPKAILTCPIWHWGVFYTQTVQAVIDGTWSSSSYWGGWKDGIVDLSPLADFVPEDVAAMATAAADEFKSGAKSITTIFTGPLNDQTGAEKLAAGTAMTDEELLGMGWFVEGVDGTIEAS